MSVTVSWMLESYSTATVKLYNIAQKYGRWRWSYSNQILYEFSGVSHTRTTDNLYSPASGGQTKSKITEYKLQKNDLINEKLSILTSFLPNALYHYIIYYITTLTRTLSSIKRIYTVYFLNCIGVTALVRFSVMDYNADNRISHNFR